MRDYTIPDELELRTALLLQIAGEYSFAENSDIAKLNFVLRALGVMVTSPQKGRSTLNNDGSPLQLCFTSSSSGSRVRLIGDPASAVADPLARIEAGKEALYDLLEMSGATSLASLCEETIRLCLPRTQPGLDLLKSGVCWLSGGLPTKGSGLALYLNAGWGGHLQRLERAERWLKTLLPKPGAAQEVLNQLHKYAILSSLGLEGNEPGNTRLKIYWRLSHPMALNELGIALFSNRQVETFINRIVGANAMKLSGLVFSAGFQLSNGELADIKIDVCGHCLPYSPETWSSVLDQLSAEHNLAPFQVNSVIQRKQLEVAFVGFGLDQSLRSRLNLYLKVPNE